MLLDVSAQSQTPSAAIRRGGSRSKTQLERFVKVETTPANSPLGLSKQNFYLMDNLYLCCLDKSIVLVPSLTMIRITNEPKCVH
jgi:hypothetical protein